MGRRTVVGILFASLIILTLIMTGCREGNKTSVSTSVTPVTGAVSVSSNLPTTSSSGNWWDKFGEPQYGGTLIVATDQLGTISLDPAIPMGSQYQYWLEGLFTADWKTDRNVWSFTTGYTPPEYYQGWLAEKYEIKEPLTVLVFIRKGIHWQNKPPVNGRELTAEDIQYSYDRALGTGDFTEKNPFFTGMMPDIEKVNAVDRYTLEFKLKRSSVWTLGQVLVSPFAIAPPEWIKQYGVKSLSSALGGMGGPGGPPGGPPQGGSPSEGGAPTGDASSGGTTGDWTTAVGSGPWIISEFVRNVSLTVVKNPDYWGYDERHPQNKLPYIDTYKNIAIADTSTMLAALRTAKIDMPGGTGAISWQQMESLFQTTPELPRVQAPGVGAGGSIEMRIDKAPFSDIRVRKALNMALDRVAMAKTIGGGWKEEYGLTAGLVSPNYKGFCIPFNEWPEDLKAEYTYNPEKAKELLKEAGYPNGFKTKVVMATEGSIEYMQAIKAYFKEIGVDMEIEMMDKPTWMTVGMSGKAEQMIGFTMTTAMGQAPLDAVRRRHSTKDEQNFTHNNDSQYDAIVEKIMEATTMDEAKKLIIEADMYTLRQHWAVQGYMTGTNVTTYWPWVKGYSGESTMGNVYQFYFARWWIDQNLKKKMGH